jgi:hypothetical protein
MTGYIVSVFPFRNRVSSEEAFEGLELGEGKLSRPVLRGPGGRKAAWLLDDLKSKLTCSAFIQDLTESIDPRSSRAFFGKRQRITRKASFPYRALLPKTALTVPFTAVREAMALPRVAFNSYNPCFRSPKMKYLLEFEPKVTHYELFQ